MDKFVKLPWPILNRTDLTLIAKVVYAVIVDRIGENGHAWPGVLQLSRDIDCGRQSVLRALSQLEAAGLLIITRRANGQVNHYALPTSTTVVPVPERDRYQGGTGTSTTVVPEPVPQWDSNQTDRLKQQQAAAAESDPPEGKEPADELSRALGEAGIGEPVRSELHELYAGIDGAAGLVADRITHLRGKGKGDGAVVVDLRGWAERARVLSRHGPTRHSDGSDSDATPTMTRPQTTGSVRPTRRRWRR